MKIEDAIRIVDRSTENVVNKKEKELKLLFSNILQELKYKELSPTQTEVLEKELDAIFTGRDLSSENVEKELQKILKQFLKSLRVNFSLLPDGYWAGNGRLIGMIIGILLLIGLSNFTDSYFQYYAPLGGLLLGVFLGSLGDRSVRKRGRSLPVKI